MKARILLLLICILSFHAGGVCQQQTSDCDEQAGSSVKVFAFIGELMDVKKNDGEGFLATYTIIKRICGSYAGDTVRLEVDKTEYDSCFEKIKHQLLMLTKDSTEDNHYKFHSDLRFDAFKTGLNQWSIPRQERHNVTYGFPKNGIKRHRMGFRKDAFYDVKGMTKEEIDIAYPGPYYRIKKDKAFPYLGNSAEEVFQHEKEGRLIILGAYERPTDSLESVVREVVMADFKEEDPDSLRQVLEKEYSSTSDSLKKIRLTKHSSWI